MDWHGKARRARSLTERRRYAEAAEIYRELCGETHSVEPQYDRWLEGLGRCLVGMERYVPAAYVYLYLQRFDDALALLGPKHAMVQARVLVQRGEFHAAARIYETCELPVAAAIAFERAAGAEQDATAERARLAREGARRCYERLLQQGRVQEQLYAEALVLFNLGYCCLALADERGHGHLVAAQRRLEEAADAFETAGQRERAFDCYQILLELGRRSGAFENLAEGYINCARILRQDNLKYYALQYDEDFVREAMQRREYHAAASLYREAAEYCRRTGMVYDRHYLRVAAETWLLAAEKVLEDGGAAEMAENALLAAVECSNAVGDFASVGGIYERLSRLELGQRKVERYEKISRRYKGVENRLQEAQAFPEYLRQPHAYPEIWYLDLVEWEQQGSVEAVCGAVVGDLSYPEVVRRRALNLLFLLHEAAPSPVESLARVAEGLGDLQIYAVLSPLEQLMERPSVEVKSGVMRALRFLFFKRSFNVLILGLQSDEPAVKSAAIEALGRLHFNHAFDPLQRIFRESDDVQVRATALESIGRIPSLEAGDFLLQVLREEGEPLRGVAKRRLMGFENREFLALLRQQHDLESGFVREDLGEVLRRAGEGAM